MAYQVGENQRLSVFDKVGHVSGRNCTRHFCERCHWTEQGVTGRPCTKCKRGKKQTCYWVARGSAGSTDAERGEG
jgi:hypothetical protein